MLSTTEELAGQGLDERGRPTVGMEPEGAESNPEQEGGTLQLPKIEQAGVAEPNGEPSKGFLFDDDDALDRYFEKAGFTGKRENKLGHQICYQNGKRVPCNKLDSKKKPPAKKPVKPEKRTVAQTVTSVKEMLAGGEGTPKKFIEAVANHTVAELKQIQTELGLTLKGSPTKAERAKKMATEAIKLAKKGSDKPKVPEKPQEPKTEPAVEKPKSQPTPSVADFEDKQTIGDLAKKTGVNISKLIVALQNLRAKDKLASWDIPAKWNENTFIKGRPNLTQDDIDNELAPPNVVDKLKSTALKEKVKSLTSIVGPKEVKERLQKEVLKKIEDLRETLKKVKDPKKKAAIKNQILQESQSMYRKLSGSYDDKKKEEVDSLKKALKTDNPVEIPIQFDGGTSDTTQRKTKEAHEFLTSVMASGGNKMETVVIKQLPKGGRAFYMNTERSVNCTEADGVDVYIHEFVHGLEYNVPGVHLACTDFIDYRCGNEKPISLKEKFGGGYSENEKGRKDNFEKAFGSETSAFYAGKHYEHAASEVLTMGVQLLYNDPSGFATRDPEYCAFVVGVLDGSIRGRKQ